MTGRGLPVVLALACGGLLGGCTKPARTVILITLDTTRADRLGCYGYRQGHTPVLDGLAGESVVFEQAQAAVPVTLPSHTTMFTGQGPAQYGYRRLDPGTAPQDVTPCLGPATPREVPCSPSA